MRKGETGFNEYYAELFGGRWEALSQALATGPVYSEVTAGLLKPYYLDPASYSVANLLPVGESDRVLDLCAAPGGKTLVLAGKLGESSTLVANERSSNRRERLHRVLAEHLPPAVRSRVRVTGHDARKWGLFEPRRYNAVLADVPCSAERHQVIQPNLLGRWNEQRIRRIAADQFAILAAAIDSTAPGGTVVYSTCALAEAENDGVLARALKRRANSIELVPLTPADLERYGTAGAEQTRYGLHILPDATKGAGPMFVAMLRKL